MTKTGGSRHVLTRVCLAVLMGPMPLAAQAITIGLAAPATPVDPHFFNGTPTKALALHIFDRLAEQDLNNKLVPDLAPSGRPLEETVSPALH